jgi:hypothetical protein
MSPLQPAALLDLSVRHRERFMKWPWRKKSAEASDPELRGTWVLVEGHFLGEPLPPKVRVQIFQDKIIGKLTQEMAKRHTGSLAGSLTRSARKRLTSQCLRFQIQWLLVFTRLRATA